MIVDSLSKTVKWIKSRLVSDNPADWKWGKLHTTSFIHTFGRIVPRIFNVGPLPVDGDTETLLMSSILPQSGYINAGSVY